MIPTILSSIFILYKDRLLRAEVEAGITVITRATGLPDRSVIYQLDLA